MKNQSLIIFDHMRRGYPDLPCIDFTRSHDFIVKNADKFDVDVDRITFPFLEFASGALFSFGLDNPGKCEVGVIFQNTAATEAFFYNDEFLIRHGLSAQDICMMASAEDAEQLRLDFNNRNCTSELYEKFANAFLAADPAPGAYTGNRRVGTTRCFVCFPNEEGNAICNTHRKQRHRELVTDLSRLFAEAFMLGVFKLLLVTVVGAAALVEVKNITLRKVSPQPLRAERRRNESMRGKTEYRVLDIAIGGPAKETGSYGPYERDSKVLPLHLVRAHFHTYVEKGLFGKYFGKFLIPDHARGSASAGKIEKTYRVNVPHDEAAP